MATLSLTVGPVTATRTVATATAMTSIGNYLAAYGGPVAGTNQEKLDWYFDHLIAHTREVSIGYTREVSIGYKRETAGQAAKEAVVEAAW